MGRIVKAAGVDRSALIPLQSDEARAAARLVIRARRAAAGIARSARQQVKREIAEVASGLAH